MVGVNSEILNIEMIDDMVIYLNNGYVLELIYKRHGDYYVI